MSKGVLVDLTKCIGCGSCTVACKMYNENKWIEDRQPTSGENAKLADENWTVIKTVTVEKEDKAVWRYVKEQCFHCIDPACASACFAKAFQKTPAGPVVYYPDLCVGCRYCMVACPFDIPKYEWEKSLPYVTKCMMCSSRVEEGQSPACVAVCPTQALIFGERQTLLEKARETITNNPNYVQHIYGEKEVGGTEWLYISDVSFEKLGFKTGLTEKPLSSYTSDFMKYTPIAGATWAVILGGIAMFNHRKDKVSRDEKSYQNLEHNQNNTDEETRRSE
ncbi:4Fe-4S dicluster domain-containing protein [Proteus faecis]|uniref:4Fe-4S dicluster domain-containing protein n=1 Tax=Proteus faecis TaxID=2050967 RepID=UPI000D69389E|nr:4Fe-4S dicluster domain-containing protein [Proteus faecis]